MAGGSLAGGGLVILEAQFSDAAGSTARAGNITLYAIPYT